MTEPEAILHFTRTTANLVRTMPLSDARHFMRGLLCCATPDSLHDLRGIYQGIVESDAQLELLAAPQMTLPLAPAPAAPVTSHQSPVTAAPLRDEDVRGLFAAAGVPAHAGDARMFYCPKCDRHFGRRWAAAQGNICNHCGSEMTDAPHATETDQELEAAVHEDFAEYCRMTRIGVRKPLPFGEYRRQWLAGWSARDEADPRGKAHDSEG